MAKVKGNSNHVGGTKNHNDEANEKKNKNKVESKDVSAGKKTKSGKETSGFGDRFGNSGFFDAKGGIKDIGTYQGEANFFTDRRYKENGKGGKSVKETGDKGGFRNRVNLINGVLNMRMDQLLERYKEGKHAGELIYSDYAIHMGLKIKAAQLGAKATGEAMGMFGDAVNQYERGRRLR